MMETHLNDRNNKCILFIKFCTRYQNSFLRYEKMASGDNKNM